MRRATHHLVLLATAALALAAREPHAETEAPAASADDLLGAIDFAPQRSDLDAAMPATALDQLVGFATDETEDPGKRLRAIRALALYPSDQAKGALLSILGQQDPHVAPPGTETLYLRAAIESLAEIGGPDEVPVIAEFLEAIGSTELQGLDLRATAARALGVIGSPTAVTPLRARQNDPAPEVRFAITEALRAILGS
jgi:HEAT repeat protein